MRLLIMAAALAFGASSATALDMKSTEAATNLGAVLAAEAFCGLSYDQAAIQAWIEANVPADAMDFPSTLSMMTSGSEFQQNEMSGSAKTAHCSAIARTAKHYGFVK